MKSNALAIYVSGLPVTCRNFRRFTMVAACIAAGFSCGAAPAEGGQSQSFTFASLAGAAIEKLSLYSDHLTRLAPITVEPPQQPAGTMAAGTTPVPPGPPLREPDPFWIESTLASMTLDEKIGQMLMPSYNASAGSYISDYHVGGFIFLGNGNTAPAVLAATNSLQGVTSVPLLFSTDCEAGLGARFTDATRFPLNMGSAAAYDLELMRQQGRVTARECRAIGIQIGFGPVLDINTQPINPIIGIRSFGDDPTSAAALARAYVEGANAEGLLCTFKHFPGHGASAFDSHLGLPTINISLDEIEDIHVAPYAELINGGIGDLVMTAHVWYPALDPGSTPWPATLSTAALTGILRDQLDYEGCVITDAFDMGGLQQAASTYDGVKHAVLSGVDIILVPPSVSQAFNGLKDRVLSTEISMERINASVRRILTLKSRVGIPELVTVPESGLATVAHPDNISVAEEIGRKAITGKLDDSVLPVLPNESLGVFVLSGAGRIFYSYSSTNFTDAMAAEHANTQVIAVPTYTYPGEWTSLMTQAAGFDKVLVVTTEWGPQVRSSEQVDFINDMVSADIPVAFVSFGSPYHWNQFPGLQNFLCGFSSHYATQQEMAKVVVGESVPGNNWPVELEQVTSEVTDWEIY